MKALFILSSPHGGSTLLSHLIGRHPDAANLGEITMIPKYLRLGELCTCGCRVSECSAWARVFAVILDRTGVALKQNPYAFSLGDHIKVKGEGGIIDEAHQTRLRHFVAKARGALDTAQLL